MAHTLSIIDVYGNTIALASADTAAGYKLIDYAVAEAMPEVTYNASPLARGNKPVFSRRGNIVETATVHVFGSSRDDALNKVRALYRALDGARAVAQSHHAGNLAYLAWKPDSSTNTAYSILYGGTVAEPRFTFDQEAAYIDSKVLAVQLTFEREPFWRANTPVRHTTVTNWSTSTLAITTLTPDWGEYNFSNLSGDYDAPCLVLALPSSGAFDRWIMGYVSQKRCVDYAATHVIEAETFSAPAADTTLTTDGSASPGGGGNTKYRCDFSGSTSTIVRLNGNLGMTGRYRLFARVKLTAAGTCPVYVNYADSDSSLAGVITNATVNVTRQAYHMIDLGVVQGPLHDSFYSTSSNNINIRFFAGRTSGTPSLDIDLFVAMPLEYYVDSRGVAASNGNGVRYVYDNTMGFRTTSQGVINTTNYPRVSGYHTGNLLIPPGNGTLVIIRGDSNFENALAANATAVEVYRVPVFASARGSDA